MTRRNFTPAIVVATLVLALAAPAFATIAPFLDLDDLERDADVIVLGTVRNAAGRLSDDGRIIETRIDVEIERALKGGPRTTLSFAIPGGTFAGTTLVAEGAPRLEAGERVVLFLGRSGGGPAVPLGVAGWNQGHFRVERDRRTGRDLVTQPRGGTVYVDRQGRPHPPDSRLTGPTVLADFLKGVEAAIERGRAKGAAK
ncbi:MAG TPA: hypothetical protein VJV75_04605 [Candidatus Polarisedimenticolia bacterium]|nr:hypothetical protein [Candidatus Polarisedimenticolia bacterium]